MPHIPHESEPVITNNGGVLFNESDAEKYGTRDNEKGERVFFIDFKNGTKVEYPRQSNGAEIKVTSGSYLGATYSSMNFNNLHGGTVWDSPSDDHYYLNNTSNLNVHLDNNVTRTERDTGKKIRDYDTVYCDINNVSVIGNSAKVNEKNLNIGNILLGDNNNISW